MHHWDGNFELTPNRAWYQARHAIGAPSAFASSSSSRETSFRSFAPSEQRLGLFAHRDLNLGWNTRQTRLGRVTHRVSFLQTTILHEFSGPAEAPVHFTKRVAAPQLITYRDNDWVPPPRPVP